MCCYYQHVVILMLHAELVWKGSTACVLACSQQGIHKYCMPYSSTASPAGSTLASDQYQIRANLVSELFTTSFSFYARSTHSLLLCLPACLPACLLSLHLQGEGNSSDEEAALAAQASKEHDKGMKPYTKLLYDNNWQPPAHDDTALETLDPARVLGSPIERKDMENLEATRQAVNEHLLGSKFTTLPPSTQAEVRKLAAFYVREACATEFDHRAKAARQDIGKVLGDMTRSKAPNSPIDLTETPERLRKAARQLQEPHLDSTAVTSHICTTLDSVVDMALEAMRNAESAGGPAASIDVTGTDFVRGELLAHHKAKKSEQTLDGFGMRLAQSRDKLAACYKLAKDRGHDKLACDLLEVTHEVLPDFDNFMAVGEKTSFEVAKSLFTSMGNPFAKLSMSKAHWDHLVALAKSAKYREAIHTLGDLSPVPLVNVKKRRRTPPSEEDSSSDEAAPKRKRGRFNSPPGRKAPFCTFCKRRGHVKEDCRKKANAKQQ